MDLCVSSHGLVHNAFASKLSKFAQSASWLQNNLVCLICNNSIWAFAPHLFMATYLVGYIVLFPYLFPVVAFCSYILLHKLVLPNTWLIRPCFHLTVFMDTRNRSSKILFWNVRGSNSQEKWDAIRAKVCGSACQILCLQETKRNSIDHFFIRKFCPRNLDSFALFPSVGASGRLLTV